MLVQASVREYSMLRGREPSDSRDAPPRVGFREPLGGHVDGDQGPRTGATGSREGAITGLLGEKRPAPSHRATEPQEPPRAVTAVEISAIKNVGAFSAHGQQCLAHIHRDAQRCPLGQSATFNRYIVRLFHFELRAGVGSSGIGPVQSDMRVENRMFAPRRRLRYRKAA